MTNTPSVEGDRLERIARIVASASIDSRAVRSDEVWAAIKPSSREECFDYARQIAALPCKGGEAGKWVPLEPTDDMIRAVSAIRPYSAQSMTVNVWRAMLDAAPSTEPDTGRGLREARAALTFYHLAWDWTEDGDDADGGIARLGYSASQTAKPQQALLDDAGGRARQALAALSDTQTPEMGIGQVKP